MVRSKLPSNYRLLFHGNHFSRTQILFKWRKGRLVSRSRFKTITELQLEDTKAVRRLCNEISGFQCVEYVKS